MIQKISTSKNTDTQIIYGFVGTKIIDPFFNEH